MLCPFCHAHLLPSTCFRPLRVGRFRAVKSRVRKVFVGVARIHSLFAFFGIGFLLLLFCSRLLFFFLPELVTLCASNSIIIGACLCAAPTDLYLSLCICICICSVLLRKDTKSIYCCCAAAVCSAAVVNQVLDSIINISVRCCSLWPEKGRVWRAAARQEDRSPLNCSSIRKSSTFVCQNVLFLA